MRFALQLPVRVWSLRSTLQAHHQPLTVRCISTLNNNGHRHQKSAVQSSSSSRDESSDVKTTRVDEGITGAQESPDLQPKKNSFAKEILLGRFDTDILTFPEALDKERYDTLNEMIGPVERFYREEVDSKKIDAEGKIPEKVLQGLRELGLYGQQVPVEYGGLGLGATEYARMAEVVSLDGGIAVTMAAHQTIGFKGILLFGTEEQKQKYLPKFASGEMLAAFALTEPGSGSDAGSVTTSAKQSPDGNSWTLNGSKIWISNGGTADFFTVFARTADPLVENSSKTMTAFLVERKFGGVTSGKAEDKLGIRGSNTAEVYFENTVVPKENVLGSVGDGFKIAVSILNSGRFSMGSAVAGSLRSYLELATDYAVTRKQFGRPLAEFALIKEKLARCAMKTYAMESMAYMTAGLIDSEQYTDLAVEAAIVKVYSSEAALETSSELLQIFGGSGYMKDLPFERNLRDSRILLIFEGTNEILRLFISLMGLKHAGKELRDFIKKLRNPFSNPTLFWQTIMQRRRQTKDEPKLTLELDGYVHPSLKDCADMLEYSVLRLQYAVELILERHGNKIADPKNQMEVARLANVIIDVYVMTCCLARASRSYCIGLPNADREVFMARAIIQEASARTRKNVLDLQGGEYFTTDSLIHKIADRIIETKGYFPAHPLTKTFW